MAQRPAINVNLSKGSVDSFGGFSRNFSKELICKRWLEYENDMDVKLKNSNNWG